MFRTNAMRGFQALLIAAFATGAFAAEPAKKPF